MIELLLSLNLAWSSDWMAEEVGYENLGDVVVGLYIFTNESDGQSYSMYIDVDNMVLLEIWKNDDDEES